MTAHDTHLVFNYFLCFGLFKFFFWEIHFFYQTAGIGTLYLKVINNITEAARPIVGVLPIHGEKRFDTKSTEAWAKECSEQSHYL